MSLNPYGYDAVLLVFKFGDLFTNEDTHIITILQQIFGKGFLRNHGILLFTGGDNFETDEEVCSGNMTFDMWLARQKQPHLQALLEECGFRSILFNNRCSNEQAKQRQIHRLIQMIDDLTKGDKRYTEETFKSSQKDRDKLLDRLNAPSLKDDFIKKLNTVFESFEQAESANQIKESLEMLQHLQKHKYVSNVSFEENEPFTNDFIKSVNVLLKSIEEKKGHDIERDSFVKAVDKDSVEDEFKFVKTTWPVLHHRQKHGSLFKKLGVFRCLFKENTESAGDSFDNMSEKVESHSRILKYPEKDMVQLSFFLPQ